MNNHKYTPRGVLSFSSGEEFGVPFIKVTRHGQTGLAHLALVLVELVTVVEDEPDVLVQILVGDVLVGFELLGAGLEVHGVFDVLVVLGKLLFVYG